MSEPIKRNAAEVKQDIEILIAAYKNGFKDKMPGNQYFDGYRAALDTIQEEVKKIKTEM